jgi:para-nitrobenzyl esterase
VRRPLLAAAVAVVAAVSVAVATALVVVSSSDDGDHTGRRPQHGVVDTSSGAVRGVTDGAVRTWRGLPYAAPPTGPLRWQPPRAPAPWDGVREAATFAHTCTQPRAYRYGAAELSRRPGSAEDCLYLNVVRPDDDTDDLPVMVYLHGGGFYAGSGSSAAADATALVGRGIVLVTINYRLGRLGFFAHPSLGGRVANYGLLDQVAALRWVRRNIAEFGGDAGNVTLVGASAGAMSVNALMASPAADGLFQRAVSQSAPSDARALPLSAARGRGEDAFPGLTAAELRALPADELLSSTFNTIAGDAPIVDDVLPASAARAFARGDEAPVPYLTGTTLDEFNDAELRSFSVDPDALRGTLGGDQHERVVAAYGDDYADEVLDDLVFDLPALERAVTHARRAPTFRYVFRSSTASDHGAEGDYVFDTVTGGPDGALSDAVADYWVAFARTGRPEVPGRPAWPEATGEASAYLALEPGGPTAHAEDPRLPRLRALRTALS